MRSWGQRLAPAVAVAVAAALPLISAPLIAAPSGAAPSGAAPSGAAPKDRAEHRAPLWETGWRAEGDPEESTLYLSYPTTAVDPETGDVFALLSAVVHRIAGDTGAILSSVPVASDSDVVPTTAPGSTQQFTWIHRDLRHGVQASAVGFDGTLLWRRTLTARGDVESTHTHPVTGTTCAAIEVLRSRTARGVLACVDCSGRVLFERSFARPGEGAVADMRVTADPRRSRWYVADIRREPRGETTRVRAFNGRGRQVWTRAWTSTVGRKPAFQDPSIDALTVDPVRGRVILGSADGRTTRISVWDRRGNSLPGKRWSWKKRRTIEDIVVSADGRRTFVVYLDVPRRRSYSVVALRPDGRQVWKRRHPGGGEPSLVVADDRRRLLLVGSDVTAYDWQGNRRWRGRTDSDFLGFRGHYDPERGRFIVPWTDEGWPAAGIMAWRV